MKVDKFGKEESVTVIHNGCGEEQYPSPFVISKNDDDVISVWQDENTILLWDSKKEIRQFCNALLHFCTE